MHSKAKAEESHRARWGDPLQGDFSIDVGCVAREGERLTPGKNHSFGCLHLNHRWSNGHWKERKRNVTQCWCVLGSRNAHTHVYLRLFTWFHCQEIVLWSDSLFPQSPCAHIAALIGLLCVVDGDALLQACRKLETRGQSSTGTCFQAQVVQTRISCQAGDGSCVSLSGEDFEHHWFSERIVRICQEKYDDMITTSCLLHSWRCDGLLC